MPSFESITVGQALPALALPPLSRTTLALYAGASGDHNPIHIDSDYARAAGLGDVFAQGMLPMAWLGRLLAAWVAQDQVRQFEARFVSLTRVGDQLVCSGVVTAKTEDSDGRQVTVTLQAVDQHGDRKIAGWAVIGF